MKKGNLKVMEKREENNKKLQDFAKQVISKTKDATEGLSSEQLDEINMELQMSIAVMDMMSSIDPEAELNEKTLSYAPFYIKEKIHHVFKILNGEET